MAAPAAHPHSEFIGQDRAVVGDPNPVWTPPSRNSVAVVAGAAVGLGSEPLHPRLEALHHGGAPSSGPSKEQQSSFAQKWGSLTAGAREKLARLSERFKKDPNRDADLDGGGSYNQMQQLGDGGDGASPIDRRSQRKPLHSIDDRFAAMDNNGDDESALGGGSHASFISAEEAAELQAGYAYGAPAAGRGKKNAFTVDDGQTNTSRQSLHALVSTFCLFLTSSLSCAIWLFAQMRIHLAMARMGATWMRTM